MEKFLIKDKQVQQRVVNSLEKLWDLTDDLVEFYPRYPEYTITVFGSARIPETSLVYQDIVEFSAILSRLECNVVTGGGPGVMEAANCGAQQGKLANSPVKSVGINIELPFEQTNNPYLDECFPHKTFFTRLQHFVAISDCFVAFYGGIGTVLEILTVLQLMQVKKIENCKLILVGEMWHGLIKWFEAEMLKEDMQLIHQGDLLIPQVVNHYQDALDIIKQHKIQQNF
ncbi:MAG: hypothetical protein RLZZ293_648 [Pseudomonadota bacterium]|jgi:uncharacterized protein (TIGR00730 family)